MKIQINLIEITILLLEIVILIGFSLLIFFKLGYSFNYFIITFCSIIIIIWRIINYHKFVE